MIDALKDFLEANEYSEIFIDNMPTENDVPEAIGLFCWSHTASEISDGTGTYFVQIQVRRKTAFEAKKTCSKLFAMLDSGIDEEPIQLTENKWCIARPRRGAVILDRTAQATTYYCEIALWGEN